MQQLQDGWYGNDSGKEVDSAKLCESLVKRSMADADKRLKQVGGLTGSMNIGVKVKSGAVVVDGDGDTDMSVMHIEEVDLTQPDPELRGNDRPAPLTLSADQDTEEQLRALDEGSAELVATDDAELQIGDPATAPPESPARAAQQRAGRSAPAPRP